MGEEDGADGGFAPLAVAIENEAARNIGEYACLGGVWLEFEGDAGERVGVKRLLQQAGVAVWRKWEGMNHLLSFLFGVISVAPASGAGFVSALTLVDSGEDFLSDGAR